MILSFFNRAGAGRDPDEDAARGQAVARLRLIRDYWTALCAQRADGTAVLPRRADISPRGIDGALSQAFLIERVAPGIARLRIAGMDLNDLMAMDVRGMPFSCLLDPAARDGFGRMLERVLTGQAVLEAELEAERDAFRPTLRAQLMILPLAAEPDGRRMAFGGMAMIGQIGKGPRRFHVARHTLIGETQPLAQGAPVAHQPGVAESAASWKPQDRRPARKPDLRLVK